MTLLMNIRTYFRDRVLAPFFIHSTPHSNPYYGRWAVYKPRYRHGYPLMFHYDMNIKPHSNRKSVNSLTRSSIYPKVIAEMLELHNHYRKRHCASPLIIDEQLNQIAQSYAEHLAATSKFEHSGNKLGNEQLGENLYVQWISHGKVPISTKAAIKSWYDEIALHDFKNPKFSTETGHFTQMVWRSTKKLGVGVAVSPNGREVYFVTNYYPAGNIVNPGYFEKNVLPPNCK